MTVLIFLVSLLGAIAIGIPIAWSLLLCKLFLRHVGCSPSDYRRQFKNCFAEQAILSEFPQPVSLVG